MCFFFWFDEIKLLGKDSFNEGHILIVWQYSKIVSLTIG